MATPLPHFVDIIRRTSNKKSRTAPGNNDGLLNSKLSLSQVSPRHARLVSAGFRWSGTFHSVGARLLREYAGRIGLDPAFTIHDREDSADLMNLVRHELALSTQGKRFPLKGTCLAIYSAAVNTQAPLS